MSPPLEDGALPSLSPSDFPHLVIRLGEFFASREVTAYLVGGIVRDTILGRDSPDIDVAVADDTRKLGAELAAFLGGHDFSIDDARGIVRVVMPEGEGVTAIDITPLPDGIGPDLSRRDFTLDAMAVPVPHAGARESRLQVIDPYHGLGDLRDGVIRVVSQTAIEADPARLMRAPRLAAQLGLRLADETAELIRSHAHLVNTVAPERVRDELLKILSQPSPGGTLRSLDDLGLLSRVLPELAEAKGVTQPKEHHWDVFDHCIETVDAVERVLSPRPRETEKFVEATIPRFDHSDEHFAEEAGEGHTRLTMLKLAGLLHDIAKPSTRTVESSGRIRFLGHHKVGAETARRIMGRLRFSRRATDLVGRMVEHHLRPGQMAQEGEMPTARAVYRYFRDVGDAAIDTLYLNLADYLAARGPSLRRHDWADHCRVTGHILREGLANKAPDRRASLIDGDDIMRTFCLAPGPTVGHLLELAREAQATGEISSRDEAVHLLRSSLSSGDASA